MKNVYRYINKFTNDIEYVGIVYDRPLYKRIKEHAFIDKWNSEKYKVEYISCKSRTDVEYLEAHFIAKWETYNYYNVAKKNMGKSNLIDDSSFEWIELHPFIVDGFSVKEVAKIYAGKYINTADEEKDIFIKTFESIKGRENYIFFSEVRENMPQYVKEILFNTKSKMIELSIDDFKYLTVRLKDMPQTECYYMTTEDFVYIREYVPKSIVMRSRKIRKTEYHKNLKDIINSFALLDGTF